MYEFVVEKRQSAPVSSGGWMHVYSDNEESKARSRYRKSLEILKKGWRIRLRNGSNVLEDKTIIDDGNSSAKVSSTGLSPTSVDTTDVDDIYVDADWMSIDGDCP